MPQQNPLGYCISSSRCDLCQFKLEDGDLVMVTLPSATQPITETYEFPFKQFGLHNTNNGCICMCGCKYCRFEKEVVLRIHSSCYKVTVPYLPATIVHAAMKHSLTYPFGKLGQKLDKRKNDIVSNRLAQKLIQKRWPRSLPLELWTYVAQYLVREYATITTQELALRPQMQAYPVYPCANLFARYIFLDGKYYVQEIWNSNSSETFGGKLLLEGWPKQQHRTIYIGEDHLGIRSIQVAPDGEEDAILGTQQEIPGVWWYSIYFGNHSVLQPISDGTKLRDFKNLPIGRCPDFKWPMRNPPENINVDIVDLEGGSPEYTVRMHPIDCNGRNVTGLSIPFCAHQYAMAHTHRKNEDLGDLGFYEELASDNDCIWFYMPIDEGERITEICRSSQEEHSCVGLMFFSNYGRATVFGFNDQLDRDDVDYACVCELRGEPSQVFLGVLDPSKEEEPYSWGERWMAYEPSAKPLVQSRSIPETIRPLSPFHFDGVESCNYFSCALRGVTEVTLCVEEHHGSSDSIIGMLLKYEDGHRECVGQMRFDWATEPFVVGKDTRLRIGMVALVEDGERELDTNRSDQDPGKTKVICVTMDDYITIDPCSWIKVPWRGTLEWFHDHGCNFVRHSDVEREPLRRPSSEPSDP